MSSSCESRGVQVPARTSEQKALLRHNPRAYGAHVCPLPYRFVSSTTLARQIGGWPYPAPTRYRYRPLPGKGHPVGESRPCGLTTRPREDRTFSGFRLTLRCDSYRTDFKSQGWQACITSTNIEKSDSVLCVARDFVIVARSRDKGV